MLVSYQCKHEWQIDGVEKEGPDKGKVRRLCLHCEEISHWGPEGQSRSFQKRYGKGFYTSEAWLRVRYIILATSERVCVLCGSKEKPLHVDHIKPRSRYPELELSLDNLQILCWQCNKGKSNEDEQDFRESTT